MKHDHNERLSATLLTTMPMQCLEHRRTNQWNKTILTFICCIIAQFTRADMVVNGLKDELKNNVLLTLALTKEPCNAPKWRIEDLFDQADQDIDKALRAFGYYHASAIKTLDFSKECWIATLDITKGERVKVANIEINILGEAQDDKDFARLLKKLPLKQGSSLHHGKYEQLKNKIESLALDKGYLKGDFVEKKLIIDKQNNSAQIKLTFDAGKRMKFGPITVQQTILDNELINRFLTVKTGDDYSSEQLAKTYNGLSQSGYFESVEIRSDMDHIQNQQVPIAINLSPKKRAHYGFGIGYDTDIGLLLNASYINRRINEQGYFFTANLDLSAVLSTAEAEYNIPLQKPTTDFLTFGGGLKREHTSTFESFNTTVSVRHKHAYSNGWRQILFLDYLYEDFKTADKSGHTFLLVPGGNWLLAFANNPLKPTRGYRVEFEVKGSFETPISNTSFLEGYLSAVWLHKLFSNGLLVGRTLQGGMLVDDFDKLPTTYRFFAGGINSVRGYGYKELGPKDSLGEVQGGHFLSVFSAEYEHKILKNWGLAGFVDTGNAYNLENIDFKTGVGLGVRWYSPIGPVRVDFAVPLDPSDSSFQVHFAAGGRI